MHSPGINGEGELRGQPANPGSPGKMAVKTECVCVCVCVCAVLYYATATGCWSPLVWLGSSVVAPSVAAERVLAALLSLRNICGYLSRMFTYFILLCSL